jgi:hypothetical protein
MRTLRLLILFGLVPIANAQKPEVVVLAFVDAEKVAASGMAVEHKRDMPDFSIIYLRGPERNDVIGIFEGANPSTFGARGKRLGEIRDSIAGQAVVWACWSMEEEGKKLFGAEVLVPSRRIIVGEKKDEILQQFHVFVVRSDLRTLAEARKVAAGLIKKTPNKAPEPTPGSVTPRATERASR